MTYSFCEAATEGNETPWHIRADDEARTLCGREISSPSLRIFSSIAHKCCKNCKETHQRRSR
jgi:hypothetical protein